MTSYFQLIVIQFWQNDFLALVKNSLDLILASSKVGMQCVRTHDQVTTRSQMGKM